MKEPIEPRRLRLDPAWATPVFTALAGMAYLIGFLQMAFFASALGVTARDLGFDVQDYTLLALLNAAALAVVIGASWVGSTLDGRTAPQLFGLSIAAPVGVMMGVAIAVVATGGFALDAAGIALLAVVCGMWIIGVALFRRGRGRTITTGFLVTAVLGVGAMPCYSAHIYARRLQADVFAGEEPRLPPWPLRPALQPVVGIATRGTAATCAIRIAPDVLLGRRAISIGNVDRFTVKRCDLADVPFG